MHLHLMGTFFAYCRMLSVFSIAFGDFPKEFNIDIRDKKGAKNLAADHLSRLENPHKGDLVEMEMNDNFPHEFLNMISLNDDNEASWRFADIANYLVEEKSSGNTTSQSDHSLPDYEAFCFDINHQEEKSSGSTISHSDPSLLEYESFYFDLLIDTLPPADRSDSHHEEFADELAHIICPPEYDHFYFDIEVDPGELTRLLIDNSSSKNVNLIKIKEDNELKPKTSTKELTIHELNDLRLLLSNCDSTFSEEFYEIDFLVLFPSRNKDKIFDPGIYIIKGVYSKRSHIIPLNDFVCDLLLSDPSEIETFLSFPVGSKDKVFDPGILLIDGVLSFMRKSPHLFNDNFKIDKRHISSEASLKIKSLICFHPKDNEIRGESS
ncbi:hypothetical protein Tco_0427928 [Tanacetum coccineum]